MNKYRATIVILFILATGSAGVIFTSCKNRNAEGTIVCTRVNGKIQSQEATSNTGKNNSQTQIIAINPADPANSQRVLTASFFSANSPQISTDGKFMLFAGQQKQGDTWQIWETNLYNLKTRQLTKLKNNCTDPAYLPIGRFVFSNHIEEDSLKSENSICTCNIDGTDLKRVTFNPHAYYLSHVLNDGRILASGYNVFPETGDQKFFVMRPDGTKSEMFYKSPDGSTLVSQGLETSDGRVIFVEKDNSGKSNIISISYNRPLHTRENMTQSVEGSFLSAFPEANGKILVTYRKSASEKYGLWEFDPKNKTLDKAVYSSNDFDIVDAVTTDPYQRQRKMPSEVNPVIKTGLIMCQDVNVPENMHQSLASKVSRVARVEIEGVDSSMGSFKPSSDGSFYLKVMADKPFQIRTLDENGKVIKKCDWLWLRPNERRGCVGCHEDQDLSPDNRIPRAVRKAPIGIPIHVSKIKDKMIDTE